MYGLIKRLESLSKEEIIYINSVIYFLNGGTCWVGQPSKQVCKLSRKSSYNMKFLL